MPTKLQQPAKIYPASGSPYQSVTIDISDNGGYMVTCREKEKPSTGDSPSTYAPPKSHVFTSFKELEAFLEAKIGGQSAAEGEEAE